MQNFSDASRRGTAAVDLSTGKVRALAQLQMFDDGFVQAAAVMSDTFTLRSGAGTNFSFDYSFDGGISADAKSIPEDPGTYLINVFAAIAVFRPGVAEWNNWFGLASNTDQEIFFDQFTFSIRNPSDEVDQRIDEFFSFNTTLNSDLEQFQVFITLDLVISTSTPQTVTSNFFSTGTLEFSAAPNVEVFSGSGVFPNTQPIPEPSTVVLAVLGVGLFALRRRRNRSCSTV